MPKSLKPNVEFWIHVFARLEGGSGVLHDDEDLSIIYQTLYDLPRDRERRRSLISVGNAIITRGFWNDWRAASVTG